jgi:PAS domain S-box-containing protein
MDTHTAPGNGGLSFHRSWSFWLTAGALASVAGLLVVHVETAHKTFLDNQRRLAERSVDGSARLIYQYLQRLQFQSGLFAEQELRSLVQLARDPGDIGVFAEIEGRLGRFFAESLAFSLADSKGEVVVENFDGKVDEVCRKDIRRYALDPLSQLTYIHPNPEAYHFDVVTPVSLGDLGKGLFLVSFRPNRIARVLGDSELYGHRLLLLNKEIPGLIEVTDHGSRQQLQREFKLTKDELGQVVASQAIPGTKWVLVDLMDPFLGRLEKRRIWRQDGLVLTLFSLFGAIMYALALRAERNAARAQLDLQRANLALEERVAQRTRALEEANLDLSTQVKTTEEVLEALRRSNLSLARAQSRLRQVIDGSLAAMILIDAEGRVMMVNPSAERLLGYGHGELIGQPVEQLLPQRLRAAHVRRREEYMAAPFVGAMSAKRLAARCKDGREICVEVGLNPLETETDKMVLAVVLDISDRVRFEGAMTERNEALERSNRELREFAYVASHDLQEPLRKITAFGDRLASRYADALGQSGQDYLARMLSAASRMSRLIEDLLTFSRITTRAHPFKPTDLNNVLQGVLEDLEVRIRDTGALVSVGELPVIDADATQMHQLFQNLIGNALKYSKPGAAPQVKVDVRRETLDSGVEVARIEVADRGIGFESRYAERIFHIFERLHTREQFEGTGVGLAVCRRIAERHGGRIWAEGRPGEGATFTVLLPLRHAGDEQMSAFHRSAEPAAAGSPRSSHGNGQGSQSKETECT